MADTSANEPGPRVMGVMCDVEVAPAPKQTVMHDPKHSAGLFAGIQGDLTEPSCAPKSGETVYTKALCLKCSIGEVLGNVIIGTSNACFCLQQQADCGQGGQDGCLKCLGSCELFKPSKKCGCFCKTFCIKCGLVSPLDEPYTALPCQ
mmetsp:Transcript_68672/g.128115  ORF Transcript_68672/g.128115 Transcript_68672/m.128115 type:complete len:148 (+) Transcript_68672:102-545(+)